MVEVSILVRDRGEVRDGDIDGDIDGDRGGDRAEGRGIRRCRSRFIGYWPGFAQ